MGNSAHLGRRGLTLIELLVGVAILAAVLALGVPSLQQWLLSQRVGAVSTQLLTDLQLARSEAITRGLPTQVSFGGDSALTCYVIHVAGDSRGRPCNCAAAAGTACNGTGNEEIKTVSIDKSSQVTIVSNQHQRFEANARFTDENLPLSVTVGASSAVQLRVVAAPFIQRPSICAPSGSTVPGFKPCAS